MRCNEWGTMDPDRRDRMLSEYAQGASVNGLCKTYAISSEQLYSLVNEASTGAFLSARHLIRVQQLQNASNQSPEALAKVWGCQPSKVDAILRMLQAHGALRWTDQRLFYVTEVAAKLLKEQNGR